MSGAPGERPERRDDAAHRERSEPPPTPTPPATEGAPRPGRDVGGTSAGGGPFGGGGPRRRLLLGLAMLTGGSLATALLLYEPGPTGVAVGLAPPEATEVALVDAGRRVVRQGELDAERRFAIPIPATAREPVVVFHGPGGSMVESGLLAAEGRVEVPSLRLWRSTLRSRHEGEDIRFDWAPIPSGAGYPEVRRYSLLFRFRRADGGWGETSLLSEQPIMELPLGELEELLRERDPDQRDLEVMLRVVDPTAPNGPMWIAATQRWELPARPAPER